MTYVLENLYEYILASAWDTRLTHTVPKNNSTTSMLFTTVHVFGFLVELIVGNLHATAVLSI